MNDYGIPITIALIAIVVGLLGVSDKIGQVVQALEALAP